MANAKKRVTDAMAYVDVLMNFLSKLNEADGSRFNLSISPFDFLLNILRVTGQYDKIVEWMTNYIIYALPVLEVGVKGIILTHLKNLISCSSDPRIPYWMRKQYVNGYNSENTDRGIMMSLQSIDVFRLLDISPFEEGAEYKYFGCYDTIEGENMYTGKKTIERIPHSVYSLARAEDYNAFLWFAIHKARFVNPTPIFDSDFTSGRYGPTTNGEGIPVKNLLGRTVFGPPNNKSLQVLEGNVFVQSDGTHKGNTVSLCINTIYDDRGYSVENTVVPASDDWNSVNWYVNKADYFGYNLGFRKAKSRNYTAEKGICNVEYVRNMAMRGSNSTSFLGSNEDKLLFTILPKPFIHYPKIVAVKDKTKTSRLKNINFSVMPLKRILFNAKGEPDNRGKYSLNEDLLNITSSSKSEDKCVYSVSRKDGGGSCNLTVYKNGEYSLDCGEEKMFLFLSECYNGMTVYEFNYDYVMGMKLFDARVFSAAIIDAVLNSTISLGVDFSYEENLIDERISEIIDRMLSGSSEYSDCFFTFSNAKWEALQEAAEKKRQHGVPFGESNGNIANLNVNDIRSILAEYNEQGTPDGQRDVITRAFNQAGEKITMNYDEDDRFQIKLDFITNIIRALTRQIVLTILSPKLLMLIQVNKALMGEDDETPTLEKLLRELMSLIMAIIAEIRDKILKALLDLVISILQPLIELMASKILLEQLEMYRQLIRSMIEACSFSGGPDLITTLDNVNYADIDQLPTAPDTGEC